MKMKFYFIVLSYLYFLNLLITIKVDDVLSSPFSLPSISDFNNPFIIPLDNNIDYLKNFEENLKNLPTNIVDIPDYMGNQYVLTNLKVSDETMARKMASLAGATYSSDEKLINWNCDHCIKYGNLSLSKVFIDNKYQVKSFVGIDYNNQQIILSFRGSSNLANWIQNAKLFLVPLFSKNYRILVHRGFKQAVSSLSPLYTPIVKNLLAENPTYKIVVAGHSLGGAIATLAVIDLKYRLNLDWDSFELFTYGQPRTGNRGFVLWFNSLNLMATRVINYKDNIPHLPFRAMGYYHHHNELWIKDSKSNICKNDIIEDTSCSRSMEPLLDSIYHRYYWDLCLGLKCSYN